MDTQQFLATARNLGLSVVGIGDTRHPMLGNESFPFHTRNQIFTPDELIADNGIHRIAAAVLAETAGIYGACANSGQAQADTTGLEPGVWVALANGEWGRVA